MKPANSLQGRREQDTATWSHGLRVLWAHHCTPIGTLLHACTCTACMYVHCMHIPALHAFRAATARTYVHCTPPLFAMLLSACIRSMDRYHLMPRPCVHCNPLCEKAAACRPVHTRMQAHARTHANLQCCITPSICKHACTHAAMHLPSLVSMRHALPCAPRRSACRRPPAECSLPVKWHSTA